MSPASPIESFPKPLTLTRSPPNQASTDKSPVWSRILAAYLRSGHTSWRKQLSHAVLFCQNNFASGACSSMKARPTMCAAYPEKIGTRRSTRAEPPPPPWNSPSRGGKHHGRNQNTKRHAPTKRNKRVKFPQSLRMEWSFRANDWVLVRKRRHPRIAKEAKSSPLRSKPLPKPSCGSRTCALSASTFGCTIFPNPRRVLFLCM